MISVAVVIELIILIFLMIRVLRRYKYVSFVLYLLSLFLMASAVFFKILWHLNINIIVSFIDHRINIVDLLITECILSSIVMWALSIHFMDYGEITWVSVVMIIVVSMVSIGELFEQSLFESTINLVIEIVGLIFFAYIVINHFIRSQWGLKIEEIKKFLILYIGGFLFLIITGFVSLIAQMAGPPLEEMLSDLWLLGLVTSLFVSGILIAKYPLILFINISRPKKFVLATKEGLPIASFSFISSDGRDIDPAFISSALFGVSSILKEITGKKVPLNSISLGDYFIMVHAGEKVVGYLFVEKPSKMLQESVSQIVREIENEIAPEILGGNLVILKNEVLDEIKRKVMMIFPYVM